MFKISVAFSALYVKMSVEDFIMDLWTRLKHTKKPIVLYGMGDGGDKIIKALESYGIDASGVFASDGFVRRKLFHGMPLLTYAEAKDAFSDMIVLVAFGTGIKEVLDNIKRISGEQELYVPDVPVAGNTVFNTEFAKENADKMRFVYDRLATERDRFTFESLVRYKLSGRAEYLYRCEDSKDYAYSLLGLKADEVYVDCGAFIGDTVAEFVKLTKGYTAIYAIEPDGRTFRKLCANTESLGNIQCINAAVADKVGTTAFFAAGSRGSKQAEVGKEIPTVSIDSMLESRRASYIKMDVEGMEGDAIDGAFETIKQYRPKMYLSCYHRSEDLFDIPLRVLNIRDDYKLHIVHHPCLPAWDTAFVFV